MPRYKVTRSHMATEVANVNADTYEQAYGRAVSQGYWKTYQGNYRQGDIDIVEIEDDDYE